MAGAGRAAGTAGPCRADRRAGRRAAHRRSLQGQVHRHPLGNDVHPRRFRTADMGEQHRILGRAGSLVDAGELRTTLTEVLGPINAANLREAHRRLESGRTIGKLALAGW
ncbi:MAG TPA: zinc-binding dehydrogenase [Stenotrophomonas sp.]|nr:zinc-binding dehydrogenase [Stenotrophomonas sp.]